MMMMTWPELRNQIFPSQVADHPFWGSFLHSKDQTATVHLAILRNPYLDLMLRGEKTVESRLSVDRRTPFNRIKAGDVILLKESGGPIVGVAYASEVWFLEGEADLLDVIQNNFGEELHIEDPMFWQEKSNANYASLIRVDHVVPIEPVPFKKRDQRSWVILAEQLH